MKLLNSFQLATSLAYFSIAAVQAISHRIFVSIARLHELGLQTVVKSRPNTHKMAIILRYLMELLHC